MKIPTLYIIFLLASTSINAQNLKGSFHSREVIFQNTDTLIKANILTEEIKEKPSLKYTYFWYSKGSINSNTGGYGGKLLHGRFQAFVNDKLVQAGQYDKGLKTGKWISWFKSGAIKWICYYKNGILDGEYILYNENGEIITKGLYKKGRFSLRKSNLVALFKKQSKKSTDQAEEEIKDGSKKARNDQKSGKNKSINN